MLQVVVLTFDFFFSVEWREKVAFSSVVSVSDGDDKINIAAFFQHYTSSCLQKDAEG